MTLRSLFLFLPIGLLSLACASTPKGGAASEPGELTDTTSGKEDKSDEPTEADKVQKKERELSYARLELKIARMETEGNDRECKSSIEEAERELKEATLDREHFVQFTKEIELAKSKLGLDRGAQQIEESRQELSELESMYKQEELAALTKELVLTRGKKKLEMAQRNFDLDQKEANDVRDFEHPKKLRDLDEAVAKAEKGLREAKAKQTQAASEKELKLLKAEHEIDDLERELQKMKAKPAKVAKS
jgi:hypothetical protein